MALWMIRAGKRGERESYALERGLAVIGWEELADLTHSTTRELVRERIQQTYPEASGAKLANWVGQIWAFRGRIQTGDLVVLPLKTRSVIAIGRITGAYQYGRDEDFSVCHSRPVNWLRIDLPRSALEPDLLFSLGALQTVCEIKRNDAEQRICAVIEGSPPPASTPHEGPEEDAAPQDVEALARDRIRDRIGQRFRGHRLAHLIAALLQAQGYQVQVSGPGPDGGVDILAGRGPMGFDSPRICVQVKSSDEATQFGVLQRLQGAVHTFGANEGLLVSWGGFTAQTLTEARRHFFQIRLWEQKDVLDALTTSYSQLPEDMQAEIPLKRIWTLLEEGEAN